MLYGRPGFLLHTSPVLWVPAVPHQQIIAASALLRPFEVRAVARQLASIPGPAASIVAGAVRGALTLGILRYERDPVGTDPLGIPHDPWRSPRQTHREQRGDCEDLSLYWASILDWLCPQVHFVVGSIWQSGTDWSAHAWVEGYDSLGWFLLEATNGALHRHQRPWIYGPESVRVATPGMYRLLSAAA